MTGDQLRGLVRAVEGSVRHVYGVGERPRAEVSGELGAMVSVPGPGHVPVWLTRQRRLVTETPHTRPRPSPLDALRWVGEPAGWDGDGALVRARAAASRSLRSARTLTSDPAAATPPAGDPAAWLVPGGPDTLPLYEAVHPVTGDQLLSSDAGEARTLGYSANRLLGHLVAAAPVTGVLGLRTVDLAWTRRERGHAAPARGWGALEQPEPGTAVSREAFFVRGLALYPPEPVVRVEVELDGEPAGRARIGMPRADHVLWQQSGSAQTTVCAFEFPVTSRLVHPLASEVQVDAVAVRADGRRFILPGWAIELEPPRPTLGDPEGRLAGLRERTAELVVAAQPPPHEGLKVLAFAHRLDLGGAQRYFFELLARLAAEPGFACTVVCPATGPYTAAVEALGIPVHLSAGLGPGDPEAYEGRLLELAAWAAPQGFDLVWANTFDAYPGADLAARLGVPSVWSLHESFDLAHWWAAMYGTEAAHPYARMRAEESLREAGALVFAADATRRQYEPHAAPERMHTLPYGIELSAIDRYRDEVDPAAARERLGLPADATVVLCLGTIEPRKGQAVLAQAFGAIASRHPDAVLAIVGDLGGDYSTGLHAYLDRAGLGDRVRIEPVATDPYAWHAAADVSALASDIESSPIVVLEAMAFGTPVVATAVFGVPELIEDGVNGYLCEASDIDSLGSALERALGDPDRNEVGAAGERRVRERHDPERYAERMSALMAGLVEGGAPAPRRRAGPAVSVLIPTLNAGDGFESALEALRAQDGLDRLEILVADSGSDDDTVAVAQRAGARVQAVDGGTFNHGAVRNLLAAEAGGDVLVTTVQDAALSRPTALCELAEALEDDAGLAGVSATQEPGPGADLFSRWSAWLHSQGPRRDGTLDNVCAAIRPAAWEQLRFRELEFGEDVDFARRAAAAGWGVAWSERALVAHHHDRPAGYAFARAAVHRLQRGFDDGLERHPVAAPGVEPLLAALPTVLGRLQAAQDEAMPEDGVMSPARYLRRVSNGLRDVHGAAEPQGELESIAGLCAAGGPTDGALPALADELLASLEFPWLLQFALAQPDPVTRQEADAFLARFVGSALGEVIGDALRDAPESEPAQRLRRHALSPT